jgi:hypothetical protein
VVCIKGCQLWNSDSSCDTAGIITALHTKLNIQGNHPITQLLLKSHKHAMSDDENDEELLALLRQSLGIGPGPTDAPPETSILRDAQFICDNSIDVALDMAGTRTTASSIFARMQERSYSTKSWRDHELHPKMMEEDPEAAVNFIFTMDLLNFCFWSYKGEGERYCVEYPIGEEGKEGKRWTGYWSLVAALRRGLDEGEY